ncbi:UNVERIFIED_CONTAM: Retrovirus-related Pol polyprotein from transposon TNT 1-94 [Sesamum latifolium]|uniref:Retrovirus-related Pol polyprotein from transposon TNT 1-94 n=1 Tax=Sesamum latifolium TaxID=2727402 RepID=A0AAW2UTT8_9LAMI
MVRSMMSFIEFPPSFCGYALETTAKLLNIAPSKTVPQTPYEIWHGKPASYKYLRVWGSPSYVKRLVGDKLDSRSTDNRRDEVLLEESSKEPQHNNVTSFEPSVPTDGVPVIRRSTRESRPPGRVDFEETYLPVAMAKFIQILLAIATCQRVSLLLEKNRKFVVLKGPSTASNKLPKNEHDHCVYKKISGSSVAYLVLYVNDILLIGNDVKVLSDIKAWLSTQFSMKDMGESSYILGIKIYRDRSRRMPDVAYALSVTSRYQACAGEAHWSVVKIILKYLKRTKDMFLIYGGGELILKGYSDASFQSYDDDAKSQSGFVFKLNGGVVAWKSSKQATTADSTTEAEYIAASEAATEAVLMKNCIKELGVVPSIAELVVIFFDNNGAIAQAKEPRSHHRSKHILRCYHLFGEMVSEGDCRMDRVSSAENTTDPLTKPMSQIARTQHLDKMGLRSMGDWL